MADVILSVGADFTPLTRGLRSLSRSNRINFNINDRETTFALGRIRAGADQAAQALEAANQRVISFGASAVVLGTIVKSIRELAVATVQTEKAFSEINSVFNLSSQNLEKFSRQLFSIARETGQAFNVAAAAALEFSRQGLSVEQTSVRVRDALTLTRQSGLDATASVESLTAAINGFSKEALTSTEIINKLIAVDTRFAVSARDLAEALSRVGSTAQDAGLDFNKLIGLVTAAQQITARGGSVIGNAFKTIFTRLQRTDTLDQLENLGVAVRDLQGNALDADVVLRNLAKSFDTLTQAEQQQIAELSAGVFQINQFKSILADLGRSYNVFTQATLASSVATNEAIRRNELLNKSLAAIVQNTKTTATELGSVIGSLTFAEPLKKALNFIQDNSVVDALRNAGNPNAEDIGAKIGGSLLKGIGNALAGPGLVNLLLLFSNVAGKTFSVLKDDFVGLFSIRQRELGVIRGIEQTLAAANSIDQKRFLSAKNVAEQERIILQILQQQNAARSSQIGAATELVRQLPRNVQRTFTQIGRGRAVADGYLPDVVAQERSAIKRGVGGAKASAKPVVIPNFNYGRGKRGTIVANSDEYIVPNYAGSDGTAVFNPNMVKKMGLPQGAKKINASGGYVPNFAKPQNKPTGLPYSGILPFLLKSAETNAFFTLDYENASGEMKKTQALFFGGNAKFERRRGAKGEFFGSSIPYDEKRIPYIDLAVYNAKIKEGLDPEEARRKSYRSARFDRIRRINGIPIVQDPIFNKIGMNEDQLAVLAKQYGIMSNYGNPAKASGFIPNFADKYKFPRISDAKIRKNIESGISGLSDEQLQYFGRAYEEYDTLITKFSQATGTPKKVFGDVYAALSPANPAEKNLLDALRYVLKSQTSEFKSLNDKKFIEKLSKVPASTYGQNRRQAAQLLRGLGNLTGQKRQAFSSNSLDPSSSTRATIDYRATAQATGRSYTVKNAPSLTPKNYARIENAFNEIGKSRGVQGSFIQAAGWYNQRRGSKASRGQNLNRGILRGLFEDPSLITLDNLERLMTSPKNAQQKRDRLSFAAQLGISPLDDSNLASIRKPLGAKFASGYIPNFNTSENIFSFLTKIGEDYKNDFIEIYKKDPKLAEFLENTIDRKGPSQQKELAQFLKSRYVQFTPQQYGLGTTSYVNLQATPQAIRKSIAEVFTRFKMESPLAAEGYIPNFANLMLQRKGLAPILGRGAFGLARQLRGKNIVTKEPIKPTKRERDYEIAGEFTLSKIAAQFNDPSKFASVIPPIGNIERSMQRGYLGKRKVETKTVQSLPYFQVGRPLSQIIKADAYEQLRKAQLSNPFSDEFTPYFDIHTGNFGMNDRGNQILANIAGLNPNRPKRSQEASERIGETLYRISSRRKTAEKFASRMAKAGARAYIFDPFSLQDYDVGTQDEDDIFDRIFDLPTSPRTSKFSGIANGYIPNFASNLEFRKKILDKGTSYEDAVRTIVNKETGSFVDYSYNREFGAPSQIDFRYIESKKKGDAFNLFGQLLKRAKKLNIPIVSREQKLQSLANVDISKLSNFEILSKAYPQIRYRDVPNTKTSGRYYSELAQFENRGVYKKRNIDPNDDEGLYSYFSFSSIPQLKKFINSIPRKDFLRTGFYGNEFEELVTQALNQGYIPNFTNPLVQAIKREKQASGLPLNQIYVDQNSQVKSGANPMGLLVANRRDEPVGGFQGVQRVLKQGGDPRKAGLANGYIPNFAEFDRLEKTVSGRPFSISGTTNVTIEPELAKQLRSLFGKLRVETGKSLDSFKTLADSIFAFAGTLNLTADSFNVVQQKLANAGDAALQKFALRTNLVNDQPQDVTNIERRTVGSLVNLSNQQIQQFLGTRGTSLNTRPENIALARARTDRSSAFETTAGKFVADVGVSNDILKLARTGSLFTNFQETVQKQIAQGKKLERAYAIASQKLLDQGGSAQQLQQAQLKFAKSSIQFAKEQDLAKKTIKDISLSNQAIKKIQAGTPFSGTGGLSKPEQDILRRQFVEEAKSQLGFGGFTNRQLRGNRAARQQIKEFVNERITNLTPNNQTNVLAQELQKRSGFFGDPQKRLEDILKKNKIAIDSDQGRTLSGVAANLSAQRQSRLFGLGFAASFAAPLLAGFVPERRGGTGAGVALGSLSGALQGAGTGAALGQAFGPKGVAIGAIAGGLGGGILGALGKLKVSSEELALTLQNLNAKSAEQLNGVTNYIQIQQQLNDAIQSGASDAQVSGLRQRQLSTLGGITDPAVRKGLIDSGSNIDKLLQFLQKENIKSDRTARSSDVLSSLFAAQESGFKGKDIENAAQALAVATDRSNKDVNEAFSKFESTFKDNPVKAFEGFAGSIGISGENLNDAIEKIKGDPDKLSLLFRRFKEISDQFVKDFAVSTDQFARQAAGKNFSKILNEAVLGLNRQAGLLESSGRSRNRIISSAQSTAVGLVNVNPIQRTSLETGANISAVQREAELDRELALIRGRASVFSLFRGTTEQNRATLPRGFEEQILNLSSPESFSSLANQLKDQNVDLKNQLIEIAQNLELINLNAENAVEELKVNGRLQVLRVRAEQRNQVLSNSVFGLDRIEQFSDILSRGRTVSYERGGRANQLTGLLEQINFGDQLGLPETDITRTLKDAVSTESLRINYSEILKEILGSSVGTTVEDLNKAIDQVVTKPLKTKNDILNKDLAERIRLGLQALEFDPDTLLEELGRGNKQAFSVLNAKGQASQGEFGIISAVGELKNPLSKIAGQLDGSGPIARILENIRQASIINAKIREESDLRSRESDIQKSIASRTSDLFAQALETRISSVTRDPSRTPSNRADAAAIAAELAKNNKSFFDNIAKAFPEVSSEKLSNPTKLPEVLGAFEERLKGVPNIITKFAESITPGLASIGVKSFNELAKYIDNDVNLLKGFIVAEVQKLGGASKFISQLESGQYGAKPIAGLDLTSNELVEGLKRVVNLDKLTSEDATIVEQQNELKTNSKSLNELTANIKELTNALTGTKPPTSTGIPKTIEGFQLGPSLRTSSALFDSSKSTLDIPTPSFGQTAFELLGSKTNTKTSPFNSFDGRIDSGVSSSAGNLGVSRNDTKDLIDKRAAAARAINQAETETQAKAVTRLKTLQDELINLQKSLKTSRAINESRVEELRIISQINEKQREIAVNQGDALGSFTAGFKSKILELQESFSDFSSIGREVAESLSSNLGNSFGDFVTGAKTGSQAFREFAFNVFNDASRLMASKAMQNLMAGIFSSFGIGSSGMTTANRGGPIKFARGGSVPALLTGGEYYISPRSAQSLGKDFLTQLNSGTLNAQKFAGGGLVRGGSGIKDDVPARLQPGGFVVRRSSVQKYGADYLNALETGRVQKRFIGGMILGAVLGGGVGYATGGKKGAIIGALGGGLLGGFAQQAGWLKGIGLNSTKAASGALNAGGGIGQVAPKGDIAGYKAFFGDKSLGNTPLTNQLPMNNFGGGGLGSLGKSAASGFNWKQSLVQLGASAALGVATRALAPSTDVSQGRAMTNEEVTANRLLLESEQNKSLDDAKKRGEFAYLQINPQGGYSFSSFGLAPATRRFANGGMVMPEMPPILRANGGYSTPSMMDFPNFASNTIPARVQSYNFGGEVNPIIPASPAPVARADGGYIGAPMSDAASPNRSSGSNININIEINNNGTSSVSTSTDGENNENSMGNQEFGEGLAQLVKGYVDERLVEQSRNGGILQKDRTRNR